MQIKVTNDHIKKGIRKNGCACPIALAIQEATGDTLAAMGLAIATFSRGTIRYSEIVPSEVTNFILNFDRGYPVNPFEFELVESI